MESRVRELQPGEYIDLSKLAIDIAALPTYR